MCDTSNALDSVIASSMDNKMTKALRLYALVHQTGLKISTLTYSVKNLNVIKIFNATKNCSDQKFTL